MAFNQALSGIQGASNELDVTGNNVANANTIGFKQSRVQFSDVYAASSLGTGGNAIGGGTRLANVEQLFTQGTIKFTSKALDVAVNGQGFFILNDGGSRAFTRAGSFTLDNQGNIVNSSGQKLVGNLADSSGNITGAQGDLIIDSANLSPTQTSSMQVGLNLDANGVPPAGAWVGSPAFGNPPPATNTYNNVTSTTIFDSLGNSHIVSVYLVKTATPNEWQARAQVDGVDVTGGPFTQVFNNDGSFNSGASTPIAFSYSPLDSTGAANGAATPQNLTVDLAQTTQFGRPFSVNFVLQDGYTSGRLDGVDIDTSGIIFGRYTNGQSRAMGQLTLANFNNTNGLQPIGDSNWGETFSSGPPLIGTPGTASLGVLQSGALEESNVDLTKELVDMIITQRNFQANAQTIKTADQTTQTIINLR
jgi:flagellar hook protein FlgE